MKPVTQTRLEVSDPVQIQILQEVVKTPNCTISQVVVRLIESHSESIIRSGIRHLLDRRLLDGGKSTDGIRLRITSNGRVALDRGLAGTIQ